MAQVPAFLGDVRKGDWIRFAVDDFGPSWEPLFFDLFDIKTRLPVFADRPLVADTDTPPFLKFVEFKLDDDFDTDGNRVQTYKEGEMFAIRVKSAAGNPPTDGEAFMVNFRVQPEDRRAFIGSVEKGKTLYFMHREEERDAMFFDVWDSKDDVQILGNVAMTKSGQQGNNMWKGEIDSEGTDDLSIGQTYWIRVKDLAADDPNLSALYSFTVLPRLTVKIDRLLALSGENLVMDNYSYDQAGNILGMRVRLFTNATDASNATAGVTEPEPGEFATYNVVQQHDVARNVRTFHSSVLEFFS